MKRMYDICPDIFYWNVQFQKDCILIPYAFYKVFGIEPVIVTAQPDEYVYAKSMDGLVVDVQQAPEDKSLEQWRIQMLHYVLAHCKDMDYLFCFGSYEFYQAIVPVYKSLRPDGIVILKMDMNSYWQDSLDIRNHIVRGLYDNCDLILCEGKRLKQLLSNKWPYVIDYLPNGYLALSNEYVMENRYDEKEDIILTVGRIGTNQKANHHLLEAFARCADRHPSWKLNLVGAVAESFHEYIKMYFMRFPELRMRVTFTGKIVDKKELHKEYRKAKIFALTSDWEGGTPNVFQEAAQYGCYTLCSQIDAADEFTNWEQCGRIYPYADIDRLTELMDEVLSPEYEDILRQSSLEMQKYCTRYYDYTVAVKKMMHLLQLKGDK